MRARPGTRARGQKAARQLGVGDATIGDLEKAYVLDVLNKNRLSYGPYIATFEREFARLHERRYAMFCNSGTSALHVAVHALKETFGWRDGDEVIVPALTFVATSNVVLHNGLRPVFVDVDPLYYEIDPLKIEEKITPKTRAIVPVHLFGQPCDMDPIMDIASRRGLRVLEDSCEAVFVRYKGRPVGSWGDIACFSTYVAHLIVTGVGGLATTNDDALAVMIKSLFNHGRDGIYLSMDDDRTDDPRKLFDVVSRRFAFIHLGYSFRGTEMEGALGLAQLRRRDEILGGHQRNAAYLTEGLKHLGDHLQLPQVRPGNEHAFMMYPIVVRHPRVNRDELIFFLEANNIETRYMLPLLNQPLYRKIFGEIEHEYPVAAQINRNGFYIGCHQGLSADDLDYIIDTFDEFFDAQRGRL